MSAHLARRFLRPRYVFFSGGYVWVVDEHQPVAALFDPLTEQLAHLVSWTELPPARPGSGQPEIVADDTGVWVQNHRDGPLVHVGIDGIDHAEYTEGRQLICAGSGGAWCMTISRRRPDIAPSPDIPPRPVPQKPALLVANPNGGTRRVDVDAAAIVSVEFDESSLYLGVEHDPWERVPVRDDGRGKRAGFEVRYSSSVLQVSLDGSVPQRIGRGTHPCTQDRRVGYNSEYADVSYNEAHRRKRAFDGALRWYWGKDPALRDTTIVRARRSGEPALVSAFELPGMRVTHGAAGAGRLWLVATPGPHTAAGRSVLTTGVDGEVRSLPAGGIDITDRCWPVGPEPLDHHSYVQYCLRGLDRMRFSDTVDEVAATYVGQWPHCRIHISFRHRGYPGLVLVARRKIYDEQGIRLDNFLAYVPAELVEQADTCAYPPVSDAVDGVLYV